MKIYSSDPDNTGLFGGHKIGKETLRIECIGTVDELNSFIGLAASKIDDNKILDIIKEVQRDLFIIGSELASTKQSQLVLKKEKISWIEEKISEINSQLDELKYFILPSGTNSAALLHVCRSISRRAERKLVALKKSEQVYEQLNESIPLYLNRLSDLFFALARLANKNAGVEEEKWP